MTHIKVHQLICRQTLQEKFKVSLGKVLCGVMQYRTQYMVFENCYMHDGLSAGVLGKGSQQFIVRNCSIARALRGIETAVDPYW